MDLDPRKLAVLLAVHRAGGVLAGAAMLHLTPSAVSQQISRLEDAVGTAVLDRQPHGAVLTPAGRALADAAERIEAELTEARKALSALQGDVAGTVVVGAPQTFIGTLLVPLVHQLRERFPGLELAVRQTEGDRGQQELRSGTLDLLVLEQESPLGRRSVQGTRDVPLLDEPWLVVLPNSLPTPTTTGELENMTWLAVDPDSAAHNANSQVRNGLSAAQTAAHSYSDYNVALSMVAGGLGIAVVPYLAVLGSQPEGITAVSLPGLGTRRLIARHRTTRSEPRKEVLTVLDAVLSAANSLEMHRPE
jgi:DNA-binding transcriptional LysR family regulator